MTHDLPTFLDRRPWWEELVRLGNGKVSEYLCLWADDLESGVSFVGDMGDGGWRRVQWKNMVREDPVQDLTLTAG